MPPKARVLQIGPEKFNLINCLWRHTPPFGLWNSNLSVQSSRGGCYHHRDDRGRSHILFPASNHELPTTDHGSLVTSDPSINSTSHLPVSRLFRTLKFHISTDSLDILEACWGIVDPQGLAISDKIIYAKFMIWTNLVISCGFNHFLTRLHPQTIVY